MVHPFLYSAVSNLQDCLRGFTLYSLAHLIDRTPSQILWEASSHIAVNRRRLFVRKYLLVSELEQCTVNELAQGSARQHRIRTEVILVESPKF